MPSVVILGSPSDLTAEAYDEVVYGGAMVALTEEVLEHLAWVRGRFLAHLDTGVICYGVNTGLGAMSSIDLSAEQAAALPRHTMMGRSAGTGPPMPREVGRGALLAKLVQLLDGRSAVTPDLCVAVAVILNAGIFPFVPTRGFGMAGEIIPLSHVVQPIIGEGLVIASDGSVQPAREWNRVHGIEDYDPQPKEGLSLISGAAVGPALAWHHVRRARTVLATANLVAASSIEALAAPLQPYGERAASLNPDPFVAIVCAELRGHLAGSSITRQPRQPPVSYRGTPQVHAVAMEAIERLRSTALDDLRANGDNPTFFTGSDAANDDADELVNSGNFHGAALAARVEAATVAVVHLGMVAEKRLYRLLDERASGLTRQLAREPGLDAGLIIVHKAALGHGASLRMLAAPVSVMSSDSSFGQEDVMSLVFPALERLEHALGLAEVLLAHELYVACVALDERTEQPGAAVADLHARVRDIVAPYAGDRPYGPDLELLIDLVSAGQHRRSAGDATIVA